ncbi:MAG TPA: TIM-barrel domain-containing protein [Candidatus Acidoferrum sp.]|nr:TIM-barrel domain-containing protein [Candidatus Acidoferrum sp.]
MINRYHRRDILKGVSAVCAAGLLRVSEIEAAQQNLQVAGRNVEVQVAPVSAHTFRLSVLPFEGGQPQSVKGDGSLMQVSWGTPLAKFTGDERERTVKTGELNVKLTANPLQAVVQNAKGDIVQQLTIDSGGVSFAIGESALLGLGEGGPQFDRRGSQDAMRSGQGGYKLGTHGGRVPIPWLIGTAGWAIYFHQPFGTFDFTGTEGKFLPKDSASALPFDIFIVVTPEPRILMAEYAKLTGHPELPPLWSFGYQQSHRTLASHDEIIAEAKAFREKKLPCDTLIYLGTGFCPSGWNTENGSFSWNKRVFPDPKQAIDELHNKNFRLVLHSVILENNLQGTVHDPCNVTRFDKEQVSCAWDAHRKTFALGVDGWWPDEGDPLGIEARLARNRMYWEGPQLDRPNERPYALHRNGYAGMQRYGSFLWSGDVYSTWETLKTHVPIAINTGLTGIPYWGTDIGGFVPTKEFSAELYLRWFQFGAFCTLFRCHGRAWKLRLPWGWNTGEIGPTEISGYGGSALPDPSELHNAQVETICRKYLELRYRLLPYLYSAVREATLTGMPVMRSLWLHYPDDPQAVQRSDEYLLGRDILVAPVVEKGATSRRLYLPRGHWFDFWTNEPHNGGREIERVVDLETLPLFVREGAILPLGPVKEYVNEKVAGPLTITVYPGADGDFLLYEDDGISFNYRKGDWMGIQLKWSDAQRAVAMRLAVGSRMQPPLRRKIEVKLADSVKNVEFDGRPLDVRFP